MVAAFDLGVTTGIALMTQDYGLRSTMACSVEELPEQLHAAREYRMVFEAPLLVGRGELQRQLEDITLAVRKFTEEEAVFDPVWISPSQWKPSPAGIILVPKGLTQHERDAIRIAAWYVKYILKSGNIPSMIEYS
jgi:hypothetical protein